MDTALVIAGTSFIGGHLCRRLRAGGVHVQATSRTLQHGHIPCDLTQPVQVEEVLRVACPRWILQCAGVTAQAGAGELHRLHVEATAVLLDAVHRHAPDAVVVLFGSAAEYGAVSPDLLPICESAPANPCSPYGRSKLAQLRVAEELACRHRLRIHVVRPFNVLGRGLGRAYFPAALMARLRSDAQARKQGVVPICNGRSTRDWVDVRDVVEAVYHLAVNAPPERGRVGLYNIASGQETSVLELAAYMCRLADASEAVDAGKSPSRTGIDRSCGDSSRLNARIGWRPRIRWQDSLLDMWTSDLAFQAA